MSCESSNDSKPNDNGFIDVEVKPECRIFGDECSDVISDGKRVVKAEQHSETDEENKTYTFRKRTAKTEDDTEYIYPEGYGYFKCDYCSEMFPTKTGRLNHMRVHAKTITYRCCLCEEKFKTNASLKKHKDIAHKDMYFTCHKCKLAFTDHCTYMLHKVTHMRRSLYSCLECNKYYKQKYSFQAHIRTHYTGKLKKQDSELSCVECNQKIRSVYMKRHMLSHTQVKLIQCLYCGKCFISKTSRDIHTRIHTNTRKYKCEICHRKFIQQIDRDRHLERHNEQKCECDYCGKQFVNKQSLVPHINAHMNKFKYKCSICDTGVSTHRGYKMHMIYKHSDDKLFHCDTCDVAFKTNSSYSRHKKSIQHKNKEYKAKLESGGV